jgi:DnaK suppressor protein
MQKKELQKYKAALEAKQSELLRALRNREQIAVEKAADAIDDVQLTTERELAITNLSRESKLLRFVQLALARIKDGSYGTCLHCERKISPKRLDAVPWAAYCVPCQEAADREEIGPAEALDTQELVDAA